MANHAVVANTAIAFLWFATGDPALSTAAREAIISDHRDPFDRISIVQALNHELAPVSNESAFDEFGVTRVW